MLCKNRLYYDCLRITLGGCTPKEEASRSSICATSVRGMRGVFLKVDQIGSSGILPWWTCLIAGVGISSLGAGVRIDRDSGMCSLAGKGVCLFVGTTVVKGCVDEKGTSIFGRSRLQKVKPHQTVLLTMLAYQTDDLVAYDSDVRTQLLPKLLFLWRFYLIMVQCSSREGLGHNLFSIGQLCDLNLEVAFRQHTRFIHNLEGVDLLTGSRGNNLYTLSLGDMIASSPICLLSKASKTKSWLWHRRLSHLNFGAINHLARHDKGTEFVNQTLREYYGKVGISHETSVALSSQQNGVIERCNHTLIEVNRIMLIYAKALLFLWVEAVATACYYGFKQAPANWYDLLLKFYSLRNSFKGTVIIEKYGMESSDPCGLLPWWVKSKLDEDPQGKTVDPTHYRGMNIDSDTIVFTYEDGNLLEQTSKKLFVSTAKVINSASRRMFSMLKWVKEDEALASPEQTATGIDFSNPFIILCDDMRKREKQFQQHTRTYPVPSLTMKVFSNMKRPTKGFSGQEVALFPTMLDDTEPSPSPSRITSSPSPTPSPSPEPIPTQPSPTQPIPTQPSPTHPFSHTIFTKHILEQKYIFFTPDSPLPMLCSLTWEVMRIGGLEADLMKTKQTYSSAYTKLILRVKKLESQIKIGKAGDKLRSTNTKLLIQEVTPTEVIQDQEGSEKASDEVSTAGLKKYTASEEVPTISTAEEKAILIEESQEEIKEGNLNKEKIKSMEVESKSLHKKSPVKSPAKEKSPEKVVEEVSETQEALKEGVKRNLSKQQRFLEISSREEDPIGDLEFYIYKFPYFGSGRTCVLDRRGLSCNIKFSEVDGSSKVIKNTQYFSWNPVKEILTLIKLPERRILKDGGEVLKSKNFKESFSITMISASLSRSVEVVKLKISQKDATLKLFKSTNQESYEHVGLEVKSLQDENVYKMAKRDYTWLMISRCSRSHSSQDKETSLNP
ncbi:integrase, catalytic region, zinc finger, CCHC-type containing protein [Tanacetum coccineum]